MGKNIVICCDGTANEFARDRTNVIKLFYALEHRLPHQIAFYHPGLGTMEPPGALSLASKSLQNCWEWRLDMVFRPTCATPTSFSSITSNPEIRFSCSALAAELIRFACSRRCFTCMD